MIRAIFLFLLFLTIPARALDLSRFGNIVVSDELGKRKAVTMLIEEIEKRTQIRLPVSATGTQIPTPHFELRIKEGPPEGFTIKVDGNVVDVIGNDERGLLFAVGYLLRHLHLERQKIIIDDDLKITTAPKYPLRGHQLGYRPKTHSYDAWDLKIWEQYYRDLIVFGANAIELVPPRTDDDADSPHFPLAPLPMMVGMSQLAADYNLDVWIWYPAMDKDYSDPATVEFALKEWAEVFQKLPRIDTIFVPGGDPGHTQPKHLLALLEKQTASLHKFHPQAQMWVSPQSFNQEWLEEFFALLKKDEPAWLSGIVFGPQVRVSLPELRAAIPAKYPIRHYPDITHTRQCQYPVPDWDVAFAVTEGRECINPRPLDQAAIFRLLQPHTVGFITYSEGCNDDVNKMIWSALGWNPDQPVVDILREYARYFIGEKYTEDFAQGLLALERNWRGPLLANENVATTLQQFQAMERGASPADKRNWRFQQALFRAYFDAYIRARLLHETEVEERALSTLRAATQTATLHALNEAEQILTHHTSVAPELRARIFELAEALFQSIRMQLSVPRYQAIGVDRGASLDTVDYPLNNAPWLREQFAALRNLKNNDERFRALDQIVNWTNPGPGGYYDDLGNAARQPHLVRGLPFAEDPASLRSSKTGFEEGDVTDEPDEKPGIALRKSWLDHAESLVEQPLQVRYTDLSRTAAYKIRVVYAGDAPKRPIRLVANDTLEIHPLLQKPWPPIPLEFDIPQEATRTGQLTLSWTRAPNLAGNGRGNQVSELWLIKK